MDVFKVEPKYGAQCSVTFSQKMMLVTWMPESLYRVGGQSKKIVAERCEYIFWALYRISTYVTLLYDLERIFNETKGNVFSI
jgi:hypothetical protein